MVWGFLFIYTYVFAEEQVSYKISPSHYFFTDGGSGNDLNLRAITKDSNYWVGYYTQSQDGFSQLRVGFDHRHQVLKEQPLFLLPSLQSASGGFWGGSIGVEYGEPWFISLSLGRTNLATYWNLNFDPNDSYTLNAGKRFSDSELIMLSHVHDNRQNPDQSHTHLIWKGKLPNAHHMTFDLLYKQGIIEGNFIRKYGVSMEYDWWHGFLKVAYDPDVNFTSSDLYRVTLGLRF